MLLLRDLLMPMLTVLQAWGLQNRSEELNNMRFQTKPVETRTLHVPTRCKCMPLLCFHLCLKTSSCFNFGSADHSHCLFFSCVFFTSPPWLHLVGFSTQTLLLLLYRTKKLQVVPSRTDAATIAFASCHLPPLSYA